MNYVGLLDKASNTLHDWSNTLGNPEVHTLKFEDNGATGGVTVTVGWVNSSITGQFMGNYESVLEVDSQDRLLSMRVTEV